MDTIPRIDDIAIFLRWIGKVIDDMDNYKVDGYTLRLLALIASSKGPQIIRALNLNGWDNNCPDPFIGIIIKRSKALEPPTVRFEDVLKGLAGSGASRHCCHHSTRTLSYISRRLET